MQPATEQLRFQKLLRTTLLSAPFVRAVAHSQYWSATILLACPLG
jgi:hypothetical protein